MQHTSSIYTHASLSQLWHTRREQPTQLRGGVHGCWRGRVPAALVTVAPSSVPRHRWCKPSQPCHARDRRCSPQRRRTGPARGLGYYWRGAIIGDCLFQGLSFIDIGEKGALVDTCQLQGSRHQGGRPQEYSLFQLLLRVGAMEEHLGVEAAVAALLLHLLAEGEGAVEEEEA